MTSQAKTAIKKSFLSVPIVVGQTESGEIDLRNVTPVGIFAPADWDSTAITFKIAPAYGGTYVVMDDGAGAAYSRSLGASKYIPLDPSIFAGIDAMKIVAGTTVAGTDSTLTLVVRPV